MINVFNIEKFATHDGPGIRTTVFLNGCPLHCPWCANPESWSIQATFMYDERKCVKCQKCVSICPKQAISFKEKIFYDQEKCIQCGQCAKVCLNDAIKFAGQQMTIEEIVSEVMKDKDYFDESQGGVTISGGEPFLQFDKFLKLTKELKKKGLHIAVETTGNYSQESLIKALPYIDLFLFDIKHLDKNKLLNITGGNFDIIMNNLQYLADHCPERVIIRVPVIPYFNFEKDILQKIIALASELGISEVDLLPYHTLGKNKWDQMFKNYALKDYKMLDEQDLKDYIDYGNSQGVKVKIGG